MEIEKSEVLLEQNQKAPSSMRILIREVFQDKMAMISLVFLAIFIVVIYGSIFVVNQDTVTHVDLLALQSAPSSAHWLGTDTAGRDIFGQLIIGARNSFTIGFCITLFFRGHRTYSGTYFWLFRRGIRQFDHAFS